MREVVGQVEHPLLEVLRTRNVALYHQAQNLITRAKEFLPHTLSTFASGTAHGPEHTTTVERISHLVIGGDLLAQLNDYELFFHVLSCHYHDLGMAGTEADNETPEARDQVRRDHAVRIAEKLREAWEELGFDNPRTAEILGEVCRGHRPHRTAEGDATWAELDEVSIVSVEQTVRTRLLAALIYAVDELHLGADRAPQRVANWKQIRNDESRRHWRRHAAIHGPSRIQEKLSYEVEVETAIFDKDIRRNVLRKALKGVKELQGQIEHYGLRASLPTFRIQWNHRPLIELLVIETMSDHTARSRAELEQVVLERYQNQASQRTDLSSFAEENLREEPEIRTQIARVVGDMAMRGHLEADGGPGGRSRLATHGEISERIVVVAQRADELDALYKGLYASNHEFQLFHSEYGKHYIRDSVFPVVQRAFSIDLSKFAEENPLRILVESCPEVSRLIRNMTVMPNIVVREELATLAAITGALSDVYRSPSIWLDKRVRHSLRTLASEHAPQTVGVLNFLEELALVTGLTPEEATSCSMPSKDPEGDDPGPESSAPQVKMKLTQTVTAEGFKTIGLPYVLLAGQRSRTKISLSPASPSELRIEIEDEGGETRRFAEDSGYVLSIGPGEPSPTRRGLWCDIEVDPVAPAVIFKGELSYSASSANLPFVLRLPLLRADQQGPQRASLQIAIRAPFVTVGHLDSLRAAKDLLSTRGAEIQLLVGEDRRVLGKFDVIRDDTIRLPGGLPDDILDALLMVGTDIPAPWFGIEQDIQSLVTASAAEKAAAFERVRARSSDEKPAITTIFLDFVTSNGVRFDEKFLGLFPDIYFEPPQLAPDSHVSQDEFNQRWDKREETMTIGALYQEDYLELAATLREWAKEPHEPFPLRIQSGPMNLPDARTAVKINFEPPRDRLWYIEHPTRITLRPANLEEQYRVEWEYWTSKEDAARVELVEDRLERLQKKPASTEPEEPDSSG